MLLGIGVFGDDEPAVEDILARAWRQVDAGSNFPQAEADFRRALERKDLRAKRRAMARLGLAVCASRLEREDEADRIMEELRKDLARVPKFWREIAEKARKYGVGSRRGTFSFHYKQGFSILKGKIVDPSEADVVFDRCAGGISSITLRVDGEIRSLERVLGRRRTGLTPDALFDAIVAFDRPGGNGWGADAKGDRRTPESDVFVARLRRGGWVKLAIVKRDDKGPWTEKKATVRYAYHAGRPTFGVRQETDSELGGVYFNREPRVTAAEKELAAKKAADERTAMLRKAAAAAGLKSPDAEKCQELLYSRRKFGDYMAATYSFRHGVRDDPGLAKTRNNWDLQFGNGRWPDVLGVRMVTDDESSILELGPASWADLAKREGLFVGTAVEVRARPGHAYLVRTKDRDSDHWTLMRVTKLVPGTACKIEWASRVDGEFKQSPGLELPREQAAALKALLDKVSVAPK